ncbi:MAG: FADH(2)-oxidizing methylenetetrahydrofolate--tRNA-(uracil(54)-C(5))-methyltransferase TrmFO [Armatimonadota bacterium]
MKIPDGTEVVVIGGGLAGTDAAWSAAMAGARVALYEMRPVRPTPAHKTGDLAELVCSNSLKNNLPHTAAGMQKQEMRMLGSLVIAAADRSAVPSGGALSVDRAVFAHEITRAIEEHPNITLVRDEMTEIPDDVPVVVATGPLTSDALAAQIQRITGTQELYFYDAASPIIEADSIDRSIVFEASRWGKGQEEGGAGGYLNCPLNEEEYHRFRNEVLAAELTPVHDFEPMKLFEGCLPVEELARRGELTLAYGPMKPIGLFDPRTGKRPFAVVQLRQENQAATLYSMVGFQTRLKWGEQQRIFRMLPGLEKAEFVRLGVMHRNTYLHSPELLEPSMALREEVRARAGRRAPLFFAGQMTGVEGYTESAATGILAGLNAARLLRGEEPVVLPPETMIGALTEYIAHGPSDNFQPMNSNLGLLPPIEPKIKKKDLRHQALVDRGLRLMEEIAARLGRGIPVSEGLGAVQDPEAVAATST